MAINEALYVGSSMDRSLINLDQICHYGIPVLDDPHDTDMNLGTDHDNVFVPFIMQGSTVFFSLTFLLMENLCLTPT